MQRYAGLVWRPRQNPGVQKAVSVVLEFFAFLLGGFVGMAAHGYFTTRWFKARSCAECKRQWVGGYIVPFPTEVKQPWRDSDRPYEPSEPEAGVKRDA